VKWAEIQSFNFSKGSIVLKYFQQNQHSSIKNFAADVKLIDARSKLKDFSSFIAIANLKPTGFELLAFWRALAI